MLLQLEITLLFTVAMLPTWLYVLLLDQQETVLHRQAQLITGR